MERLLEMLKRHEGVESHAYECSEGKTTIACGRNIDQRGGIGLSEDEIDYLLENDVERVIKELAEEYPWFNDLDDVRKDAMIDISFNLGATRLRGFQRALTAMKEGNYTSAKAEFLESRWAKQVGGRALELADMVETGEYAE
jgi:lysozyme|tara:strand:- start:559 stop:984 length:426 start_codon:yes stop_codon:yes gene_type:complete